MLDHVGHVVVGFGEPAGELGEVVVERNELLIVLVERADEQCQTSGDRDEVSSALVERGQRL